MSFLKKPSLRHGGIVLVDQGFLSVATFATGAMLARATAKEEYSLYVLAMSLILFAQGFHKALVCVPFTIYAPRLSDRDRSIYQASAFLHTLLLCSLIAAAMFATAGMMRGYHFGSEDYLRMSRLLPLLSMVTASFLLRDFIRTALLARLQIGAGIAANIVATGVQIAATAWLFIADELTVANALGVTALSCALAATSMLWSHRGQMSLTTGRRIWDDFLRGTKTAKWMTLDVFMYMGASQAYPWLLLYLTDARSVAVFGVCSAYAALAAPFVRGANAYIHPRMVHGLKDGGRDKLMRLVTLSVTALSIPYGIWLLIGGLFAGHLLPLIYGGSYSGYAALAGLLLIRAMIEGVSSPLSNALQTVERADIVTASLALGAAITLGLGTLLILQMGLLGAGIAAVGSSVASGLWKWLMIRRFLRAKSV